MRTIAALTVVFGLTSWVIAQNAAPPAAWPPPGKPVRVEVTHDTWVSCAGGEETGNNGGDPRLKTKGHQEFALLDIDTKALAGRVITGATLHLHVASKDVQRRLTVSTLAGDWFEGTSRGYRPQKGAACFRWAKLDEQPWAYPGSDLTAVMAGLGNTVWRFAEPTAPDAQGWQVVAVEPRVVALRVAGVSRGFVVFDDVGSEYERQGDQFTYHQFPNRFVHSRDSGRNTAPYLTVYLGDEDTQPPAAITNLAPAPADLPAGEAMVTFTAPADAGKPGGTIGYLARYAEGAASDWDSAKPVPQYLVPLAVPGTAQQMHLTDLPITPGATMTLGLRPVDGAGNLGPVATCRVTLSSRPPFAPPTQPLKPFADASALPNTGGGGVEVFVIDELDKVHPVTGQLIPAHPDSYRQANHLWSAASKTIRLHAAKNEFVSFQLVLSGQAKGVKVTAQFADGPAEGPSPQAQVFRFRHVKARPGPLPDPLVPCDGAIDIPAADEAVANQKHQALLIDVYVPHTALPGAGAGAHKGAVTIEAGGQKLALDIDLRVWDFTLPDHLSFLPEMNCYGLPFEPGSPQQLAYYRLAQAHRTTLNRLGYNWRGQVNAGCAPEWDGKQLKWDDYDRRWGPLLDGSAFRGLPRGEVPVEAFYLPINEHWPMDIHKAFKGGYWADEALPAEYWQLLSEVSAQFARHFRDKGWTRTLAEFYLNNKVYFKKDRGWNGCSAPWIFDEPVHTQDFWALRLYGAAFHRGVRQALLAQPQAATSQPLPKLTFRCDISRPQWQRDLFDGVLDVNIAGGAFRQYPRMVLDRKERHGEVVINYGGSNDIAQSNVQPAAWCLDAWTLGADGVLPWQTVGNDKSWTDADPLSLFYPGKAVGRDEPVPSVRLKSYRRGQQDVEYLVILAQAMQRPRWEVGQWARAALKLKGQFTQAYAEDAGRVDYAGLDPAALWAVRTQVGAALDQLKPPAKNQYVEFRPPLRDPAKLPDLGYVTVAPPR